ncbi:MAG: hypothetical protein ACT4QC_23705 [Planctomycetaceae bacterium]
MEVSIRECPACKAVVTGDEKRCNACGQELPVVASAEPLVSPAPRADATCPRCGAVTPRHVVRCRDCGAYMNPEIEAAALARQLNRAFAPARGFAGGYAAGASPAGSSFAEVADDADFDLAPAMDLVPTDVSDAPAGGAPSGRDDDFELELSIPAPDYELADSDEAPEDAGAGDAATEAAADASPGPDAATEATATEAPMATSPAGDEVPHSVQTGGDALLDAALAEERDAAHRGRGGRRRLLRTASTALPPGRLLVFCPNGHRVQVQDKHRGRTGRCPNCRGLFFVPLADTQQSIGVAGGELAEAAGAAPDAAPPPGGYTKWITDVHLHRLNPSKLRLRPGSLSAEYETVDLGAGPEHLLLAVLFSGSGPFRAMQEPKKTATARREMLEHLSQQMPLADLPVSRHHLLTPEQLQQLKIVQPTVGGEESLFADVPVFGEGRVAVRVPAADAAGDRAFLSFSLSQFRAFSQALADAYGLADFGAGTAIPLTDEFQEAACHYSEAVLRFLPAERLAWYRADPALKLQVLGRRCQKCGLIVSEDSRKKEKIGSKSDASIAKARCPKCKQKFGSITLYGLPG